MLRPGDGVGGGHARGEGLALGARGLGLGHQDLGLRPGGGGSPERLARLDPRGRGQGEQALQVRLRGVRGRLRAQALELGAVALDLDGQDLVARRHPEALAVPGVTEVRVVGADRLLDDPPALARGDERPVGGLRLEDEVGPPGPEVLRRGRAALLGGRDLAADAAAGVERQRRAGPQAPVVLDVREHHDALDRLRRVVGRGEDRELGHLGAPGVAGPDVHLRPALRAGAAGLRLGGRLQGGEPNEARRGGDGLRDGLVHGQLDDTGRRRSRAAGRLLGGGEGHREQQGEKGGASHGFTSTTVAVASRARMRPMKTSSSDGVVGRAEWTTSPAPRSRAASASAAAIAPAGASSGRLACSLSPKTSTSATPGAARRTETASRRGLGHHLDHDALLGPPQRVGAVHGQDAAPVDEGDAGAALGLVEVGRRQEQGEALALETGEELPEVAPRDGVDAGGRLVEDEKLRRVDEGADEGELLLHAAGEPVGEAVAERRHAYHLEKSVPARGIAAHVVDLGEEGHVLVHGEVAVQRELLRQVADARGELPPLAGGVEAAGERLAGVRLQEAQDHAQRRRLARPVRPDEAEHLAAAHVEAHLGGGADAPKRRERRAGAHQGLRLRPRGGVGRHG